MLRVLIVEDSATARQLLISIVSMEPKMQICGVAVNGQEAVNMTKQLKPDVVLMDIQMPIMNGFQATRIIMAEQPTPIVIVSGHRDVSEVSVAIEALRAGALTALPKPRGLASPRFQKEANHLLATVRAMAGVAVVRQRSPQPEGAARLSISKPAITPVPKKRIDLVVATASSGGPAALHQILSELPADFAPPIVIVQHLLPGFIAGLATSLGRSTPLQVKVAHHLDTLEPKTVYLAPPGRHLVIRDRSVLELVPRREHDRFCPSADVLFNSAAQNFGPTIVAIVLTGMGNDGLEGCKAVKAAGGLVAAQDERSSVIFGMPKEVIDAGTVHQVLPLSGIASWMISLMPKA